MKTRFLSALAFTICLAFTTISHAQTAAKDTTITIKVSGVYCASCPPNICARVKKENGVKDCVALGKPAAVTKFQITYDISVITYQQVVNAVEDARSCENPNEKPFKVKKSK